MPAAFLYLRLFITVHEVEVIVFRRALRFFLTRSGVRVSRFLLGGTAALLDVYKRQGVKLRLSKGDLKAVQGDGGWNSPDMVTKRYAHILDEDRRRLADEMEQSFYKSKTEETPDTAAPEMCIRDSR